MQTLVVFEFPSEGPFGKEAVEAYKELAEDIAQENGLIWKVWTEDPTNKLAGGVYLFADRDAADAYIEKHGARLAGFGISGIDVKIYAVNEGLSTIDHATLTR